MRLLALTLGVLCFATPSFADVPSHDGPGARIAPFVDDQTTAIARIDASRANAAQIKELVNSLSGGRDEYAAALLSWLPGFVQAGGKELFIVCSMADLPRQEFYVIAPLSSGVDAQRIIDVLGNVPTFKNRLRVQLEGAIFVGNKETLERLKTNKPVTRKEIGFAFDAVGAGTAQFLLIPTPDTRRLVEEVVPVLPAELGGGSIKILTRGLLWAAVGLDVSTKTSIRLVVQSEDASRALDLAYFCKTNLGRLVKLPAVQSAFPGLASLEQHLIPAAAGDRLVLNLEDANIRTLLKPTIQIVQKSQQRVADINNLKEIGIAVHRYYDVHKTLPAVANFDAAGKPLLSWRVHILPFLGEQKLYEEFHLNEPWDSEHNKKLIPRIAKAFKAPGLAASEKGLTTYLAPVAANAIWTGTPVAIKLNEITDGTSNTILLIDASDKWAVPWTKPTDYIYDPMSPAAGLGHRYGSFCIVLRADASAGALPSTISAKQLLAMFTRNGGEVIEANQD